MLGIPGREGIHPELRIGRHRLRESVKRVRSCCCGPHFDTNPPLAQLHADTGRWSALIGSVMCALPHVLIGGTQKSGTTSLHRLLERHPEIYLPPRPQEIHYFDLPENYARGPLWYASHFTAAPAGGLIAQTSPMYLYAPGAAARIHSLLPAVKLIFIFRDPVDRAYSHYWHQVRYGLEACSFEKALECEPDRLRRDFCSLRHFSYVDRGRYARQLERFAELFPRDQLLLLRTEELRFDLPSVCRRLADFLQVDAAGFSPNRNDSLHENSSRLPRSGWVQRRIAPLLSPAPWLFAAADRLNTRPARYPPMADSTRTHLRAVFAEDVQELSRTWQVDTSGWLKAA